MNAKEALWPQSETRLRIPQFSCSLQLPPSAVRGSCGGATGASCAAEEQGMGLNRQLLAALGSLPELSSFAHFCTCQEPTRPRLRARGKGG